MGIYQLPPSLTDLRSSFNTKLMSLEPVRSEHIIFWMREDLVPPEHSEAAKGNTSTILQVIFSSVHYVSTIITVLQHCTHITFVFQHWLLRLSTSRRDLISARLRKMLWLRRKSALYIIPVHSNQEFNIFKWYWMAKPDETVVKLS